MSSVPTSKARSTADSPSTWSASAWVATTSGSAPTPRARSAGTTVRAPTSKSANGVPPPSTRPPDPGRADDDGVALADVERDQVRRAPRRRHHDGHHAGGPRHRQRPPAPPGAVQPGHEGQRSQRVGRVPDRRHLAPRQRGRARRPLGEPQERRRHRSGEAVDELRRRPRAAGRPGRRGTRAAPGGSPTAPRRGSPAARPAAPRRSWTPPATPSPTAPSGRRRRRRQPGAEAGPSTTARRAPDPGDARRRGGRRPASRRTPVAAPSAQPPRGGQRRGRQAHAQHREVGELEAEVAQPARRASSDAARASDRWLAQPAPPTPKARPRRAAATIAVARTTAGDGPTTPT